MFGKNFCLPLQRPICAGVRKWVGKCGFWVVFEGKCGHFGRGLLFFARVRQILRFGWVYFNDFVKTSIVHCVGNECFASCVLLHKVIKIWGDAGRFGICRASRVGVNGD